jgi:hypothetical protein
MLGLETILIDSINNKRMNQSDHYALQLIIHFRIRSISHHSALVLLPTKNIQSDRYIHLFCPFFDLTDTEDEEENILFPLRLLLTQYEPFNIEIDSSIKHIQQLSEQIQQLFSQCEFISNQKQDPLSKSDDLD